MVRKFNPKSHQHKLFKVLKVTVVKSVTKSLSMANLLLKLAWTSPGVMIVKSLLTGLSSYLLIPIFTDFSQRLMMETCRCALSCVPCI